MGFFLWNIRNSQGIQGSSIPGNVQGQTQEGSGCSWNSFPTPKILGISAPSHPLNPQELDQNLGGKKWDLGMPRFRLDLPFWVGYFPGILVDFPGFFPLFIFFSLGMIFNPMEFSGNSSQKFPNHCQIFPQELEKKFCFPPQKKKGNWTDTIPKIHFLSLKPGIFFPFGKDFSICVHPSNSCFSLGVGIPGFGKVKLWKSQEKIWISWTGSFPAPDFSHPHPKIPIFPLRNFRFFFFFGQKFLGFSQDSGISCLVQV